MALFKISKGLSVNLDKQPKKEGNCWYTTDDSLFHIDISNTERRVLNSNDAKTLSGAILSQSLNDTANEIPSSKVVYDAISNFLKIVSLTTAEYEALETKDEATLYNLIDADEDDVVTTVNGKTGDVVFTAGEGINIDSNNVISNTAKVYELSANPPINTNLLWIDSKDNILKYYNGSTWQAINAVWG